MYFRIFRDAANGWRWHLKAANHRIIADSGEAYVHRQDCLAAVGLVKGSQNAPIYD